MMNKSIFVRLWCFMSVVLLSTCSSQDSQLAAKPSQAPVASVTATITQTELIPTSTPTEASPPTSTPYPTKHTLLNYSRSGSPRPPFHDYLGNAYSKLVLYSDGQLIITGETFQQKLLSEDEKNRFLTQLETLGFYRIESNQKQDETDTLYNFGNQYDMEDIGPVSCVVTTEKARELCIFEPYREFLVPDMKNILYFLDRYKPDGMTLYVPDRLFLEIGNGRTPNIDNLPEMPIVWPTHFPSLEINYPGVLYIEGEMAAEVFAFLGNVLTPHLVTQDGLEYTIEVVRPVLPHEVVSFP